MYRGILPEGLSLEKRKFCDIESWQMCLIEIKLNGKDMIFVIEKYQQHYGSIRWKSIYSTEKNIDKKAVIEKIREKYPKILINEEPYIQEFRDMHEENTKKQNYHYYKQHYVQEVDFIKSELEWSELRKVLNITY